MRRGGWTKRGPAYYARVRLGADKRIEVRMNVADDAAADKRAAIVAQAADVLIKGRRGYDVREYAKNIGACATDKQAALFLRAAATVSAQAVAPDYGAVTFAQFALRWTSGQLHNDHPDHVAKKQSTGDENILKNHVRKLVGDVPLVAFTLEDADSVMRELPRTVSPAYRRAVAQVVHRVLALAVWPARILKANPLPKGWLPRIGKPKAKSFLYPKEEAALLANRAIDIRYRMLIGVLCREGMRKTEARLLEWSDLDLDTGTVTLDENKTDAPRSWPLSPDVTRALSTWKRVVAGKGPFAGLDVQHLGTQMREWLHASGITRPQLFTDTAKRMHFRAHDTRSTFVTLSLAADHSESWVMRRTAHKSSTMIARYNVEAANARELGLGTLAPMDEAIPELSTDFAVPTTNELKRAGGERGRAARWAKVGEKRVKRASTTSAKAKR